MVTIILLIFVLAALVAIFPPNSQDLKHSLYFGFTLIIILIAGFRGKGIDRDYSNYVRLFVNYKYESVEPIFYGISLVLHKFLLVEPFYLFFIFALIGVSVKLSAIKQLSELWFLSLVIYLGYFFILHEMTQIRIGVACGFLLLCIKPIYERNWKSFLFFSSIAILSHYSAIIILPLWFLNKNTPRKNLLLIIIPICYIIYLAGINIINSIPVPYIKEKLAIYQLLQKTGKDGFNKINVFNLILLFKIGLFYLFIFNLDKIIEKNKYSIILIKIFAISLCSFPLFAFMPVLGFRISEFFGIVEIVLIPFLFYIFKPKILSRIIVVLIGILWVSTTLFYIKLIS